MSSGCLGCDNQIRLDATFVTVVPSESTILGAVASCISVLSTVDYQNVRPVAEARLRPMRWMWAAVLLACATWGGDSVWANSPDVPAPTACSNGWDQLLPPSQREEALRARGCRVADKSAPEWAGQLSVYTLPVTYGPLGPLAGPGAERRSASSRPAPAAARAMGAGQSSRVGGASPVALAPLIDQTARTHDIDPLLLHAIARVESRHKPGAVSHAGAHGLMQVIVPTARRFGVETAQQLHHPGINLDVSARYLKTLQQRFGNDLQLVLAAYNAGEGAVEKYGRRIPPYRETQGYVRKVMSEYALLRSVHLRQTVGVAQ